MKKNLVSKTIASALALTMLSTMGVYAAVQSDAYNAGSWAKTYVFDDFNQAPTTNTITYKPNGDQAWVGESGSSNTNNNFYRGIPSVNDVGSNTWSNNVMQRAYPYGWGPNTEGTNLKGKIGWMGSSSDGFLGYNSGTGTTETPTTEDAVNVFGWGSGIAATTPMTAFQNLTVDWENDTVEIGYDYLMNCADYKNNYTNNLLTTVYDIWYDTSNKNYPSGGQMIASYLPQVKYLRSGNLYLKVFDDSFTNAGWNAVSKIDAKTLFNIDTTKAQQWVHISAVISASDSEGSRTYTSKFYLNGRPITGALTTSANAAGKYTTTVTLPTDVNYEHKGIRIAATGATTGGATDRWQGVDNIKMVKYNSTVSAPSETIVLGEDDDTAVVNFTNGTYTGSEPAEVKKAAIDLKSFTLSATQNGENVNDKITLDDEYTEREITTTEQISTATGTDGKKVTYMNQNGTELKLKGVQPGDTVAVTLTDAKDVAGNSLANNVINITRRGYNGLSIAENKVKFNYSVEDKETTKPILIVCTYDGDGNLTHVDPITVTFTENNGVYEHTIANTGASYKAYLWSGLDTMIPLTTGA